MATAAVLYPASPPSQPEEYYPHSLREIFRVHDEQISVSPIVKSAVIDWAPNFAQYQARTAARLAAGTVEKDVPKGWPIQVDSPMAWTGSEFESESSYTYMLNDEEIIEIEAAVKHFKGLNLPISEVNKETFPLPNLESILNSMCEDLHHGKGFTVLRGLDPKKYCAESNTLIYLGISSYLAEQRGRQLTEGTVFFHVLNADKFSVPPEQRPAALRNVSQPFHSDVICDVVGMQVLGCAAKGGKSILASSHMVYNELAATRPDLIHTLASSDWAFDTFGRKPAFHKRALLYHHNGKVILNFSRRHITGSQQAPRTNGLPPISEAQAEALDAVHFLAKKHELHMTMAPGDLRFFNNLGLLHRRDAFEDDSSNSRHLIRLWLRNEKKAWGLPPTLQLAIDRVFADGKGLARKDYTFLPQETLTPPVLRNKKSCS